jgi:signal transduction histidine kinase
MNEPILGKNAKLGQRQDPVGPSAEVEIPLDQLATADPTLLQRLTPAELIELAHVAVRGVWEHSPLHDISSIAQLIGPTLGGLGREYYSSQDSMAFSREFAVLSQEWGAASEQAMHETAQLENPERRTAEALELREQRLTALSRLVERISSYQARMAKHVEGLKASYTSPDDIECITDAGAALVRLKEICDSQQALIKGRYTPTEFDSVSFQQELSRSLEFRKKYYPVEVSSESRLPLDTRFEAQAGLLMRAVVGAVTNTTDVAEKGGFKGIAVTIAIEQRAPRVIITVSDNIPGGFPENGLINDTEIPGRPRACSVFYSSKPRVQASADAPAVLKGGVGLAEISQIVNLHHGDLRITNNPEGRGSTLEISLPVK